MRNIPANKCFSHEYYASPPGTPKPSDAGQSHPDQDISWSQYASKGGEKQALAKAEIVRQWLI